MNGDRYPKLVALVDEDPARFITACQEYANAAREAADDPECPPAFKQAWASIAELPAEALGYTGQPERLHAAIARYHSAARQIEAT